MLAGKGGRLKRFLRFFQRHPSLVLASGYSMYYYCLLFRAQSYIYIIHTSLMSYFRQEINRDSSFIRWLNVTFPWRNYSMKILEYYTKEQQLHSLGGVFPSTKCCIKVPVKCKNFHLYIDGDLLSMK